MLPEKNLDCVEINPKNPHKTSVIWLHGLGADGHDFAPIVPEFHLDDLSIRFIFPHAPIRPVTINQGHKMRAWYDIAGIDINSKEDEQGIKSSESSIHRLIEHE